MDSTEGTQTAACANQTNHIESATGAGSLLQRTMVISLAGATGNGVTTANPTSIFNPAIEAFGGVQTTAGIAIAAQ